jgi:hypothetical protein
VWNTEWRTIVGVVEDVKNFSITGPPAYVDGEVYVPLGQTVAPLGELSLIARVAGDTAAFEKHLPMLVREVCPTCALSKIAEMQTVVDNAVETPRSTAWLVGGFALLALAMAAAGIFNSTIRSMTVPTSQAPSRRL